MKLCNIQTGIEAVAESCQAIVNAEFEFRINRAFRANNERMPEPAYQMWLKLDNEIDRLLAMKDAYMAELFSGGRIETQMLSLQKIIVDTSKAMLVELDAILALAQRLIREGKNKPKEV